MTVPANFTKAQLIARIVALDAELVTMAGDLQICRMELAMAKSRPALPQGKALHVAYYTYVAQCRIDARVSRTHVVSYMSFNNWVASQAFGEHVDADAAPRLAVKMIRIADMPEALL